LKFADLSAVEKPAVLGVNYIFDASLQITIASSSQMSTNRLHASLTIRIS